MNWQQHVTAAESLLKDAEQELAVARSPEELALVAIRVDMAKAHAQLAETKRVVK